MKQSRVFPPSRPTGGFTLIELVIVLTIVAIMAAVAMPRFVALQRDARMAKTQAVYGAIKSASILAKVRCELDLTAGAGPCTATAGQVNMDGLLIDMENRYPAATAAGIDAATQLTATAEGLVIAGGGVAARTFDIVGATTLAQCRISYTAAASGVAPAVTVDTSGC